MTDYTHNQMRLQLDFEYPSVISSKEDKDLLKIVIKDPSYFESRHSFQQIKEDSYRNVTIFMLAEKD